LAETGGVGKRLGDDDPDLPRNHGRVEQNVVRIVQHALECVLAGQELKAHLGLPLTEMHVSLVRGGRLVWFKWSSTSISK
jgi:hypothetical protein